MADVLDLITLAEAKSAINLASTVSSQDTELAGYVTAVSRRLDDLCGPIVVRTVTEQHDGGTSTLFLRQTPTSASATTTLTTVTEYSGGVAQVLTAESLTVNSAYSYRFDPRVGTLTRRAGWATGRFGTQTVVVVYQSGRYASTATVDAKFKQAASMMLAHLWRREQGAGTVTFNEFGSADTGGSPLGFAIPNAVLELLQYELRSPAVA